MQSCRETTVTIEEVVKWAYEEQGFEKTKHRNSHMETTTTRPNIPTRTRENKKTAKKDSLNYLIAYGPGPPNPNRPASYYNIIF